MLKQLHIQNFVIIDELDLHFLDGMTVFTGETGAGKSILVDALGLILGDRAETSIIRDGKDRTEIAAIFSIDTLPHLNAVLDDQAIEIDGDELLIRRIISRDGRSRAFINNSQVTVQALRTVGEYLIDIHGQHAHQSLMRKTVQRTLLDQYARHTDILEIVGNAFLAWHTATARLEEINSGTRDHEATLALLQYQVQELDELAPAEGELDRLDEEYRRLANANRLMETGQGILEQMIESEHSVGTQLHHAIRDLRDMLKFDASLNKIIELLDNASIQLSEAGDELKRYVDRLDIDPGQLSRLEKRLDALHDAARKHHIQPQDLTGHLQALRTRLEQLENNQETIIKLQQAQKQALNQYQDAALKLHESRVSAATAMSKIISGRLRELGMTDGSFHIDVARQESVTPQAEGIDQVEYLVSLNPGQALQPLRKVASGGELSRISLAIQINTRNEKGIPTLIFDEVDAGIGGGIAEIVGKLLKDLSSRHQIFCVTHLPQVASQGDHHIQVHKQTDMKSTFTKVTPLQAEERVEEIARMLGGVSISEKTRAHAKEMLGYRSPV